MIFKKKKLLFPEYRMLFLGGRGTLLRRTGSQAFMRVRPSFTLAVCSHRLEVPEKLRKGITGLPGHRFRT